MRRLITLLCMLMVLVFTPKAQAKSIPPWTDHMFIAHALGGINQTTYTNSYEAVVANYHMGQRVFETDLVFTSDGHLVARHDWSKDMVKYLQQDVPLNRVGVPWTLQEFLDTKINKRYSPITFKQLAKLMSQYPDMYVVTDTKETDPGKVKEQFRTIVKDASEVDPSILMRIIPQIYNQEMLDTIREFAPFPSVIYTLYMSKDTDQQVVDFAKMRSIAAITMPMYRASAKFVSQLKANGIPVYVHTTNSLPEIEKYVQIGVHGFYTDFVTQKEWEENQLAEMQKKMMPWFFLFLQRGSLPQPQSH